MTLCVGENIFSYWRHKRNESCEQHLYICILYQAQHIRLTASSGKQAIDNTKILQLICGKHNKLIIFWKTML